MKNARLSIDDPILVEACVELQMFESNSIGASWFRVMPMVSIIMFPFIPIRH